MLRSLRPYFVITCIIIIVFIAVSLLDIAIAVLYPRFYSNAAFVTTFGVGGIFGAVLGFQYGIESAKQKTEAARWGIIIYLLLTGLLSFTLLAKLEGGEYEAAFKGYGITLALGSLLFVKGKL